MRACFCFGLALGLLMQLLYFGMRNCVMRAIYIYIHLCVDVLTWEWGSVLVSIVLFTCPSIIRKAVNKPMGALMPNH